MCNPIQPLNMMLMLQSGMNFGFNPMLSYMNSIMPSSQNFYPGYYNFSRNPNEGAGNSAPSTNSTSGDKLTDAQNAMNKLGFNSASGYTVSQTSEGKLIYTYDKDGKSYVANSLPELIIQMNSSSKVNDSAEPESRLVTADDNDENVKNEKEEKNDEIEKEDDDKTKVDNDEKIEKDDTANKKSEVKKSEVEKQKNEKPKSKYKNIKLNNKYEVRYDEKGTPSYYDNKGNQIKGVEFLKSAPNTYFATEKNYTMENIVQTLQEYDKRKGNNGIHTIQCYKNNDGIFTITVTYKGNGFSGYNSQTVTYDTSKTGGIIHRNIKDIYKAIMDSYNKHWI